MASTCMMICACLFKISRWSYGAHKYNNHHPGVKTISTFSPMNLHCCEQQNILHLTIIEIIFSSTRFLKMSLFVNPLGNNLFCFEFHGMNMGVLLDTVNVSPHVFLKCTFCDSIPNEEMQLMITPRCQFIPTCILKVHIL